MDGEPSPRGTSPDIPVNLRYYPAQAFSERLLSVTNGTVIILFLHVAAEVGKRIGQVRS